MSQSRIRMKQLLAGRRYIHQQFCRMTATTYTRTYTLPEVPRRQSISERAERRIIDDEMADLDLRCESGCYLNIIKTQMIAQAMLQQMRSACQ